VDSVPLWNKKWNFSAMELFQPRLASSRVAPAMDEFISCDGLFAVILSRVASGGWAARQLDFPLEHDLFRKPVSTFCFADLRFGIML
jgi:hypothetical protein